MLRNIIIVFSLFFVGATLTAQQRKARISKRSQAVKTKQAVQTYSKDATLSNDKSKTEKVNWISWTEAYELNQKNPRKVYIDIYTDWCGYCKKMDRETFTNPEVIKYINDNFYAVKFDAEQKENVVFNDHTFEYIKVPTSRTGGYHTLAHALLNGRMGYPAFVVMDEEYSRIMIAPGYKQAPDVMNELVFANEEKYKSMTFQQFKMVRLRDTESVKDN